MEERRKYVRLDASIKVRYKVKVLKGPEVRHEPLSKNIGGGGIRFPVEGRLKKGSILELGIDLPDGARPIKAVGQVVWLEKVPIGEAAKKDYFETGTKFIRIDPLSKDRILKYVYERIHGLIYNEIGKTIKEMRKEKGT